MWNIIFLGVQAVVCLLGVLLNGLVILTVSKNLHRSSPTNYFILSIGVSDFLSCAVAVPFSIANHFQKVWPFGMAGCQAHAFLIFQFALVSITHLAAISAGKCLTITRSYFNESFFNRKQVLWIIFSLWIYSLIFSVSPLAGWSQYGLEGTNQTCSIKWNSSRAADKAYFGLVFSACFLLPIGVITFCYWRIHKVTKCLVNKTYGQANVSSTKVLVRNQHKSAMYFLVIIAAFLLSWTPYAIVSLLTIVGVKLKSLAISACSIFAKTSLMLNPILYAFYYSNFRKRMSAAMSAHARRLRDGETKSPEESLAL